MLAEAEHVEPDLVGQFDLLDQVAQPLVRSDRRRVGLGAGLGADVGESVEAEFHGKISCWSIVPLQLTIRNRPRQWREQ